MPFELEEVGGGVVPPSASVRMSASRAGSAAASRVVADRDPIELSTCSAFNSGGNSRPSPVHGASSRSNTISPKRVAIPDALAAERAPELDWYAECVP